MPHVSGLNEAGRHFVDLPTTNKRMADQMPSTLW